VWILKKLKASGCQVETGSKAGKRRWIRFIKNDGSMNLLMCQVLLLYGIYSNGEECS